ncbi:MAG: MBL fold metallo-hydrolase, partial [Cyanobacteria bacterium REEB65]|nr:MBL fold metallo-hydrolase [Cyanobacteria bacterium REEB65]
QSVVIPALWRMGCRHLALAVLTHPHTDHLGGMAKTLATIGADCVWDAGQPFQSPLYQFFLADLLVAHTPLVEVRSGQRADFDGVRMEVLWPRLPLLAHTHSDPNNNAVVLRLTYGACRILLAADVEQEAEQLLVAHEAPDLRAEILKAPHHGSRFGSTVPFLSAVRPEASIVSVGAHNTFGHPDPGALRRLLRWGPVYRTDQDGGVLLQTDGHSWTLASTREVAAR